VGRSRRPGKIAGLAFLLQQHHDALEFDAWSVGKDLLDLYRGRMTWRQLKVLVDGLGPDSALARACTPGGWTSINHQLADLFDLTAVAGQVVPQGSKKPIRAWRPSDAEKAAKEQERRTRMAREQKARRKQRGGAGG
jgi:hypothetical protein